MRNPGPPVRPWAPACGSQCLCARGTAACGCPQGFPVYRGLLYSVHLTSLWSGRWHSPFTNKGKEAHGAEAKVRFNPRESHIPQPQGIPLCCKVGGGSGEFILLYAVGHLPSGTVVDLPSVRRSRYNCSHFTDVKPWVRGGSVLSKVSHLNPGLSEFQSSSLSPYRLRSRRREKHHKNVGDSGLHRAPSPASSDGRESQVSLSSPHCLRNLCVRVEGAKQSPLTLSKCPIARTPRRVLRAMSPSGSDSFIFN